MNERQLTPMQAARLVGRSRVSIDRAVTRGHLQSVRTPLGRVFEADDVIEWNEKYPAAVSPRTVNDTFEGRVEGQDVGWLTLIEAAAHAGVSRGIMHRAARKDELPYVWPSSAGRLFRPDDVVAWAERRGAVA